MSEEGPTKCPPSHRWSSCHPPPNKHARMCQYWIRIETMPTASFQFWFSTGTFWHVYRATSDGSVCLATDKCPVCPVTFRSLSAIIRMSSDEVQMKMSYQCPTSVLLPSDYLPVAPITLLLVTYQHYICVTNWNVSDQYPTKLVGSEKSTFRPASGKPPASLAIIISLLKGGRHTRLITPREQRFCNDCTKKLLAMRCISFWGVQNLQLKGDVSFMTLINYMA